MFPNFLNRDTLSQNQKFRDTPTSLKNKIFCQFEKEILDSFRDTVNFLGDTHFGNYCVKKSLNLSRLSLNQFSRKNNEL